MAAVCSTCDQTSMTSCHIVPFSISHFTTRTDAVSARSTDGLRRSVSRQLKRAPCIQRISHHSSLNRHLNCKQSTASMGRQERRTCARAHTTLHTAVRLRRTELRAINTNECILVSAALTVAERRGVCTTFHCQPAICFPHGGNEGIRSTCTIPATSRIPKAAALEYGKHGRVTVGYCPHAEHKPHLLTRQGMCGDILTEDKNT